MENTTLNTDKLTFYDIAKTPIFTRYILPYMTKDDLISIRLINSTFDLLTITYYYQHHHVFPTILLRYPNINIRKCDITRLWGYFDRDKTNDKQFSLAYDKKRDYKDVGWSDKDSILNKRFGTDDIVFSILKNISVILKTCGTSSLRLEFSGVTLNNNKTIFGTTLGSHQRVLDLMGDDNCITNLKLSDRLKFLDNVNGISLTHYKHLSTLTLTNVVLVKDISSTLTILNINLTSGWIYRDLTWIKDVRSLRDLYINIDGMNNIGYSVNVPKTIVNLTIKHYGIEYHVNFLKGCKDLETLRITNMCYDKEVFDTLDNLRVIKCDDISSIDKINVYDVYDLSNLKKLDRLNVKTWNMRCREFIKFPPSLRYIDTEYYLTTCSIDSHVKRITNLSISDIDLDYPIRGDGLTHLCISNNFSSFNVDLSCMINLKFLYHDGSYLVTYPSSLVHLILGSDFNEHLTKLQILTNLETLIFGDDFNMEIDGISKLKNLRYLEFSSFNKPIDELKDCVYLNRLVIGNNFSQDIRCLSKNLYLTHLFIDSNNKSFYDLTRNIPQSIMHVGFFNNVDICLLSTITLTYLYKDVVKNVMKFLKYRFRYFDNQDVHIYKRR
jgi:hypothetical protein